MNNIHYSIVTNLLINTMLSIYIYTVDLNDLFCINGAIFKVNTSDATHV